MSRKISTTAATSLTGIWPVPSIGLRLVICARRPGRCLGADYPAESPPPVGFTAATVSPEIA